MTRRFLTASTLSASLLAGAVCAEGHAGLMGYALADNGATLVTLPNLDTSDTAMQHTLSQTLDAIAFRPVTGELVGFSKTGAIYVVDPASGVLTDLNAAFDGDAMTKGGAVAFDFNNKIDAVRAVGVDGVNLVYFPDSFGDERAGSVMRFSDTFYAAGDWNAGLPPMIFANAYTNAIAGQTAGSTFQYGLDARTDALVSVANNIGELRTIARVTVDGVAADLMPVGGFDIVSPEDGSNLAFAILQLKGADRAGLYRIDLSSGAAIPMGDLNMTGLTGFAVSQSGM